MNYLSEPRGAARSYALGQAPLYEPRGQAVPFGAAPLYEPRGQAVPFGAVSITGSAEVAPGVKLTVGEQQPKPTNDKILGLSKPVFYGLAAVVVAGGLYFALAR